MSHKDNYGTYVEELRAGKLDSRKRFPGIPNADLVRYRALALLPYFLAGKMRGFERMQRMLHRAEVAVSPPLPCLPPDTAGRSVEVVRLGPHPCNETDQFRIDPPLFERCHKVVSPDVL